MSRRPDIPSALRERFAERIRLVWVGRGGSAETAEPVIRETLGRVVEAMLGRQIENLDSVPSVTYRTAREVCDESAAILPDRRPEEGDPLAGLAGLARMARLAAALTDVPESDRMLLDAYYRKCLPVHAIALNLGLGPSAVRRRKDQVLQRLRDTARPTTDRADPVPELVDS